MRKNYFFILISLSLGLFIYLFYRTEKTVINEIFIYITSFDRFIELQKVITNLITLNKHIIYSLPEGIWVFSITLTAKFLFLKIGNHKINLLFSGTSIIKGDRTTLALKVGQ